MSLRYTKIKKKPTTFNRLFGVSVSQFEEILKKVEPAWKSKIIGRYKRPGRNYKLEVSDMLLMLLLYYRSYITQEFVGFLFGIDDSRVCRIIQKLEPLLAKIMAISKDRKLSKEEIENLIIDATEQPIERPKKGQKPYYSGKKKRHTLKTEIRVNLKGRIVHVSKSRPGSVHDFTLYKQEPPIPPDSRGFVDSGYQGFHHLHEDVDFPYKATKNRPLDKEEKEYNQGLSRVRVVVENVLGDIKVFRILSDRYRNKRKRYNVKFQIIAGIVNFKNGFATI
jgi:DDE superfamily endonuclease